MADNKLFKTGKFSAAELAEMRAKADKPRVLYDLGQQLRKARQAARLDRAAVAARCDVAADQLGRFEHGAADIGFAALDRYCVQLGLDLETVLLPYLNNDAEAVRGIVGLARSWAGAGKPVAIDEILGVRRRRPN